MKVIINIDGGSRGNPGPAGAGVVIADAAGNILHQAGLFIGRATNNVAEYSGLIGALKAAQKLGARDLLIRSDSELLVRQMNGQYRVKNAGLKPLFEEAQSLCRQFASCRIEHIYREQNEQADKLANMAMNVKRDVVDGIDTED